MNKLVEIHTDIVDMFGQVITQDVGIEHKYADCYRELITRNGIDTVALQADTQAVLDKYYNADITGCRPSHKGSYRNFKRAAKSDRVTKYLPEGNSGGLFFTFNTSDGVSTVTVVYKTIERMENDSKRKARVASKEAADTVQEDERKEAQALTMRTSVTADQALALMLAFLPEITTLTQDDVFKAWSGQRNKEAASAQAKIDGQKKLTADNKRKRKEAAADRKATDEKRKVEHDLAAQQSQQEIDKRTGTGH